MDVKLKYWFVFEIETQPPPAHSMLDAHRSFFAPPTSTSEEPPLAFFASNASPDCGATSSNNAKDGTCVDAAARLQ